MHKLMAFLYNNSRVTKTKQENKKEILWNKFNQGAEKYIDNKLATFIDKWIHLVTIILREKKLDSHI